MRPRLVLLATGGTVAAVGDLHNYQAGAISGDVLLDSVPGLRALAQWQCEQVFAIDSKDATPSHWQLLTSAVQKHIDQGAEGIVITHGTDTLEETAFFLSLCIKPQVPIILTAAMRPGDVLSADGAMNLFQAAQLACNHDIAPYGVITVAQDLIFSARQTRKKHTHIPAAFGAAESIGGINGNFIYFSHPPATSNLYFPPLTKALPVVELIYGYTGMSASYIDSVLERNIDGIVIAGFGQGCLANAWLPALDRVVAAGKMVVRASRVTHGPVLPGVHSDDISHNFIAAGQLDPFKAQILLMLMLAHSYSRNAMQKAFLDYSGINEISTC